MYSALMLLIVNCTQYLCLALQKLLFFHINLLLPKTQFSQQLLFLAQNYDISPNPTSRIHNVLLAYLYNVVVHTYMHM